VNWRKTLPLTASFMLLVILATSFSPVASDTTPRPDIHFVRVPSSELARLEGVNLAAVDYGAFQWLALSSGELSRLAAAGIPYVHEVDAGRVQITRYRFDPLQEGEPSLPPALRAGAAGTGFRLVQFTGPIRTEWLAELAAAGLPMLQYYPHHAYLTWGTAAQAEAAEALPFVRWQGVVHPAYKISETLAGRSGLIQNVEILVYDDGDLRQTLAQISQSGAHILQYHPAQPDQAFYSVIAQIQAADVAHVVQLAPVLWAGYIGAEAILDDEMAGQIVAGNYTAAGVPYVGYFSYLADLGYDGSGVIWSVTDTGVDYDHPDLAPRIVGGYSYPGCPASPNPGDDPASGGHGTHVAGIVGGDATGGFADAGGFLYGLGVAPGYSIFAQNPICSGSVPWPPAGGWQELSKRGVLGGALGANNSWTSGEGAAHGYQSSERTHDFMVRDGNFDTPAVAEPYVIVFSAGNSGPGASTLTAPKEAKNVIVTAASRNYRVGSINTLANFSSRGPAVDGRLGVTVAAPGEQIASTRNDLGGSCGTAIPGTNGLYSFCSGTSMAAPQVSGAITVMTEWWRTFNAAADPSPAMAKALLVNGAIDMSGVAAIPNTHEGWGRINLTNVISTGVPMVYYDQTHLFSNSGESWTMEIGVADPTKPLKITIAWSDAPGAAGANPALVNNLNLQVTSGGNTYLGNVFSSGWSVPGGSPDNLNNLESVYIQSPGGGATITVHATNIAGDGVPYNGDPTDQDFALVCYNCALFPDFTLTVAPTSQAVCAPDSAVFELTIGSIMGYDDPVELSAAGHPAGSTAVFSANPVTPPGSSSLTIGNTAAAAAGTYDVVVTGTAPTSTHSATVQFNLFDSAPGQADLLLPENNAANQPVRPTFSWTEAVQGATYTLEVATNSSFSNIVYTAAGIAGTEYTLSANLLTGTRYYWRVRPANSCAEGSNSAVFSFVTEPAPGDCAEGFEPVIHYDIDFESGAPGWSSSGTGNTWALSTQRAHSGLYSYKAVASSSVSDQRLVSPPVALPTGQAPLTLQFWNYQSIESRSAGGCWDGAILEVSSNDGTTWNYVPTSQMLTDPYDGLIQSGYSNPLAGFNGWCGDPQDWLNSIVDIDQYAGETVRFRFRLGTDSLIGREGWYIDDVVVRSCVEAGYNADLSPTSQIDALPGSVVTHAFTLANLGPDDSYNLAVSGSEWPTTLLTSSPVAIPAGGSESIQVQVEIPALTRDVVHGSDTFTLTVTSVGDPDLVLAAVGTTRSVSNPDAVTSGDMDGMGTAGGQISYSVGITNTGDYPDTYSVAVGPHDWAASSNQASLGPLAPGEESWLEVTVEVGEGATDSVEISFTSSLDPEMVRSVTLTSWNYTATLSQPDGQTALPGETVTYAFVLENLGSDDSYELVVSGYDWPATLLTTSPVALSHGESAIISVEVEVPAGATGSDSFNLVVTSANYSELLLTAGVTTQATSAAGVELSAEVTSGWGVAGGTLTYVLTVTNSGLVADSFQVTLAGHTWATVAEPLSVGPLAPGASATVQVTVTVGAGQADSVTVRLTSEMDETVWAEVVLTSQTRLVFLPLVLRP
jgi:uncharacterized membrane protein